MRTWVLLFVVAVLASQRAAACSCGTYSAVDAVKDARMTVFSGRIVATYDTYSLVSLDRTFAGRPLSLTIVDGDAHSCTWAGVRGQEYLFVTESGRYSHSTHVCAGNEVLSSAGKTLAALGPGKRPMPFAVASTPFLLVAFVVVRWRLRSRKREVRV